MHHGGSRCSSMQHSSCTCKVLLQLQAHHTIFKCALAHLQGHLWRMHARACRPWWCICVSMRYYKLTNHFHVLSSHTLQGHLRCVHAALRRPRRCQAQQQAMLPRPITCCCIHQANYAPCLFFISLLIQGHLWRLHAPACRPRRLSPQHHALMTQPQAVAATTS